MLNGIHLLPKSYICRSILSNYTGIRTISYGSLDYCINLVRTLDNENYLCTLLLPADLRPVAFAIRAFNVEIASVQDQVSKSQLGVMRLKFWDDCIEKIFIGKVPNNPVAVELAKSVKKLQLSKTNLKQLVASRNGRLDQTSFTTLKDMEKYAEASCGSVYLLLLQAAGIKSHEAELAGREIGVTQGMTNVPLDLLLQRIKYKGGIEPQDESENALAHGLCNLIRGIPHCIANRTLSLPSDLLVHFDVSEEAVLRGQGFEEMRDVLRELALTVYSHLETAREAPNLPDVAKRIFLPAIAIDRYLKALKNSGFDVFDPNTQRKSVLLPLQLYWHAFFKQF